MTAVKIERATPRERMWIRAKGFQIENLNEQFSNVCFVGTTRGRQRDRSQRSILSRTTDGGRAAAGRRSRWE
jgi:hypothetical protein